MIGSFLTRGLLLIFGYAYPGYECYKTVELNKPNIDQLQFWCQYWILVAGLTVCERIGDTFIGWLPMYGEAKLAFFIYLWFPKTKGTTYVYSSFFRPYVAKHETEIDRNLLELRTRAIDMAVFYWHKTASIVQTRFFDILQYIASQSTPPRPPAQSSNLKPPEAASNRGPVDATEDELPSSPEASTSCSTEKQYGTEEEEEEEKESEFSGDSKATSGPVPATVNEQKATTAQLLLLESSKSSESKEEKVEVKKKIDWVKENNRPPLKDVVLRTGLRRTRRGQVNNGLKG